MGQGSDEVLRDLLSLQARIYRLFDEPAAGQCGGRAPWAPPVDIYDTGGALVLVAEIPGVDREEIDLEVSEDLLVIRGERPLEPADPRLGYYRLERPNGTFQRTFRFPPDVDPAAVRASLHQGVLSVTMPKRGGAAGRPVTVEVGD